MGTLIKRMLIIKIGSPAKYHLTQQGADLGERLENAEKDEDNSQTTAMYKDSRCDENTIIDSSSPIKSSATTTTLIAAPSAATPSLDHLDHLNLSAEEKAFILEGIAQDANPASNVQPFRLEKNLIDDPVYVLSDDDDDQINFNPPETSTDSHRINFSPPKTSKIHSLSPSLSPPSSPETRTTNVLKNFEDKFENSVNDSVCVMDYDDDDDSVDLNTPGDDQTPPARLRLPSLSPVPSISESESHNHQFKLWNTKDQHKSSYISTEKLLTDSNRHDNGVIEINDDEENDDNSNFRENIFKESKSDHVHCSLSQTSESSEGRKRKNIFSNVDHLSSQKYHSDDDDDDLPDLDICVPLSKRLFNKGAVSSQLLSHFSTDHINTDSNKVNSTVPEKSNKLPTKSHASHDNDVVVLEDDDSEPELNVPFTSITPKVKTADNISKMNTKYDNIKAALPTTSECVNGPKGMDVLPEDHPTPEFTLLPGSYEIVLCIDNREFYGSKSNSKTLLPDLIQRGINCDLRLLHIGDILWVAREKGNPNEGVSSLGRKELVLNFAIERKRMDDLVSSITGGRLKEQKFRLKHCGVSELIILIEEYGSIQNFSISEDRIKQSIVNSQILDGFKVKRCGSSKEAVLYLSMMTRSIQKYYGNKTLHAASHDHVKLRAAKATVRDQEYYLMPFQTFNETSIKHKALTVKEMFGKQLIQIPGVSLERACAITKVFPTLASLLKAYENCTSEKSKEGLLATIKCGNKERNLGIAISRMMHMLYNTSKLS